MPIQIAQTGLVHARWTDEILDEVFRNVSANNPQIPAERLQVSTLGWSGLFVMTAAGTRPGRGR
ncbi:hypothetical protein [Leifsonia aquatica]|uniref:hypothetical protein n=1 Tax=Leifsonia aquatica TaxID=144185 RepID=UPI0028A7F287|nr:hypothetical protein [Leifsonia aquatica]